MMQRLITDPKQYIKNHDPVLGRIIDKITLPDWLPRENYYRSLVGSIISQQLSTRVADVIFSRFEELFIDSQITPDGTLIFEDQVLRGVGLSFAKIRYIKNLAQAVVDNPKMFEQFGQMTDEEIITELVKIKGIGRWTAEMFLIFTMARPDIFSLGDLGLRRAVEKLYGLDHEPTKEELITISEEWKPYRSLASRYLWKSLDL